MEKRGLVVSVYRPARGDDRGSIPSNKFNTFTIIDDKLDYSCPFTPTEFSPELKVVRRMGGATEYLHVEPVKQPMGLIGPMASGNFVFSNDSRFRKAFGDRPIPIHDLWVTEEAYNFVMR